MIKKSFIVVWSIIATVICIFFIIAYFNKTYKQSMIENKNQNLIDSQNIEKSISQKSLKLNQVVQTTINENSKKVSPNANLIVSEFYDVCGHEIKDSLIVPEEVVNMNEDQVKEYYSDWNVEKFSEDEIKISKKINSRCGQHYIVKDQDGKIVVYLKDENNQEHLIKCTNILTKYLSENDLIRLKNGVNIIGIEDLEKFLEDFE